MKKELIYNHVINEMVDEDGIIYVQAAEYRLDSMADDLIECLNGMLEQKGVKILHGLFDDGYVWVQAVDITDPPVVKNANFGVINGSITMKRFTESDYDGFAGADENACIGEVMVASSRSDKTWSRFNGRWTIVVDGYGVQLYMTTDTGDEACLTYVVNNGISEGLKFVADKLESSMTHGELFKLGFSCTTYDVGGE